MLVSLLLFGKTNRETVTLSGPEPDKGHMVTTKKLWVSQFLVANRHLMCEGLLSLLPTPAPVPDGHHKEWAPEDQVGTGDY